MPFVLLEGACNGVAHWGRTARNWDVSIGPLARPFARFSQTAHSFACSALLALLARSAALIRLLAASLPSSWESELLMSQNDLILPHSVLVGLEYLVASVSFEWQ